jgi:glycosyltransferase involved in cell wall biosynthesis
MKKVTPTPGMILQKKKFKLKLLIISHTEHYRLPDGTIAGWGPTIRELDELTLLFEEVIHIACLHNTPAPKSAMTYTSDKVRFVGIPPFGGPGWRNKLAILTTAPQIIATVFRELRNADVFQFRAPTSIGVYLIPLLALFTRKKGWFKYAGNWVEEKPPLSYAIQRWWLVQMQKRKVTINGRWPNQPEHLLSFENPCLTSVEYSKGLQALQQKSFNGKLNLLFVGRVETEKGVGTIIEAATSIPDVSEKIEQINIIGEGKDYAQLAKYVNNTSVPIRFLGSMQREEINVYYEKSHVLLLPSIASEGFPKVLAEAAAYGCIPIATNISSIGHYIKNGENGFLLSNNLPSQLADVLQYLIDNKSELPAIAQRARQMAELFTYERYRQRIAAEILA